MSYDDGKQADKKLISIFNRYGIKGTFHLNSGLTETEGRIPSEEISEVYQNHEVSAHTVTHPTIERSPREQVVEEIFEDRRKLESIVDYTVRGLSYPNGSYNKRIKEILPHLGIEYARTVHSTGTFYMPDDLYEWNPTCHHNGNLLNLAKDFTALHKQQYLYMMYVWGHSYEFDRDQNWNLIEEFCEIIGGRDDIWYATNIEIIDYVKAFHHLKFSADSRFVYNPNAMSIWIRVEDEIMEIKGGEQVTLF